MSLLISPGSTLADIAIGHAAASRVFQRFRLDFCCHGRRALAQACADRGLDPQAVIREILNENVSEAREDSWRERALDELIAHVVGHYHRRLREELPALVAMARRVETRRCCTSIPPSASIVEPACPSAPWKRSTTKAPYRWVRNDGPSSTPNALRNCLSFAGKKRRSDGGGAGEGAGIRAAQEVKMPRS